MRRFPFRPAFFQTSSRVMRPTPYLLAMHAMPMSMLIQFVHFQRVGVRPYVRRFNLENDLLLKKYFNTGEIDRVFISKEVDVIIVSIKEMLARTEKECASAFTAKEKTFVKLTTQEFQFYPPGCPIPENIFIDMLKNIKEATEKLNPDLHFHLASFPVLVNPKQSSLIFKPFLKQYESTEDKKDIVFNTALIGNCGQQDNQLICYTKQCHASEDPFKRI